MGFGLVIDFFILMELTEAQDFAAKFPFRLGSRRLEQFLLLLDALGLSPLLCAGLRLGEGTGALAALPLFDMAMAMYGGAEFSSYGMDAYTPQN